MSAIEFTLILIFLNLCFSVYLFDRYQALRCRLREMAIHLVESEELTGEVLKATSEGFAALTVRLENEAQAIEMIVRALQQHKMIDYVGVTFKPTND